MLATIKEKFYAIINHVKGSIFNEEEAITILDCLTSFVEPTVLVTEYGSYILTIQDNEEEVEYIKSVFSEVDDSDIVLNIQEKGTYQLEVNKIPSEDYNQDMLLMSTIIYDSFGVPNNIPVLVYRPTIGVEFYPGNIRSKAQQTVGDSISEVTSFLEESLAELGSSLAINEVILSISDIIASGKMSLSDMYSAISLTLSKAQGDVLTFIQQLKSSFSGGIQGVIDFIVSYYSSITSLDPDSANESSPLDWVFSSTSGRTKSFYTGALVSAIGSIATAIGTLLTATGNLVGVLITVAGSAISSVITTLGNSVNSADDCAFMWESENRLLGFPVGQISYRNIRFPARPNDPMYKLFKAINAMANPAQSPCVKVITPFIEGYFMPFSNSTPGSFGSAVNDSFHFDVGLSLRVASLNIPSNLGYNGLAHFFDIDPDARKLTAKNFDFDETVNLDSGLIQQSGSGNTNTRNACRSFSSSIILYIWMLAAYNGGSINLTSLTQEQWNRLMITVPSWASSKDPNNMINNGYWDEITGWMLSYFPVLNADGSTSGICHDNPNLPSAFNQFILDCIKQNNSQTDYDTIDQFLYSQCSHFLTNSKDDCFCLAPKYTTFGVILGIVTTAVVTAAIVAVALVGSVKWKQFKNRRKATLAAKAESTYSAFVKDPSKENYAAYRAAVRKNNKAVKFYGGDTISMNGFWASTSSSGGPSSESTETLLDTIIGYSAGSSDGDANKPEASLSVILERIG